MVKGSRDWYLIHLVEKTINEVTGFPNPSCLPVPLNLLRDEESELLEIFEDSVVGSRDPVHEGWEHIVCLEKQGSFFLFPSLPPSLPPFLPPYLLFFLQIFSLSLVSLELYM